MKAVYSRSYASLAKGALVTSLLNTVRCDNTELAKTNNTGSRIGPSYSHVVLGFGTAGTSAVDQLLKSGHPLDTILVVDPQIQLKSYNFNPKNEKRLTFHASAAADIDVAHKIIQLTDGSRIHYQNCLISVGSGSSPLQPPYIDSDCNLLHTVVDLTKLNAPYTLYQTIIDSTQHLDEAASQSNLSPKNIALVGGNSFETVELAGKLAIAAAQKHFILTQAKQQPQQRNKSNENEATSVSHSSAQDSSKNTKAAKLSSNNIVNGKEHIQTNIEGPVVLKDAVILVYPAYGPMSHSLPRYLSLALAKRLQTVGVQLVPYSYVRYLGTPDPSITGTNTNSNSHSTNNLPRGEVNSNISPQAVLYLAKTYDSLNTTSFVTDKVAFAPTSVPTYADRKLLLSHPDSVNDKVDAKHCAVQVNRMHPHGFIVRSGLELDNISGGVVVNQSLQACESVYVAGDVASVCNGGHGVDLSGTPTESMHTSDNGGKTLQQRGVFRGNQNALYSDTVAGRNMACHSQRTSNTTECTPLLYNHIPIYEAQSVDLGVHFTFVGNCSTALESHGYWWKLNTNTSTNAASGEALLHPPLGLGVVFYVDNHSIIHGILISGLPSTIQANGADVKNLPKAKYFERVNELCKQMIGKSVKSLDQFAGNTGSGSVYKRINLAESFLTEPENDGLTPEDTDVHSAQREQNSNISSSTDTSPMPTNDHFSSCNGTEVTTSQVLSWEARRLLSPVLSPALYKNTEITTKLDLTTHMVNLPTSTTLLQAVQHYPRPLYRYCGPSHTTIKDLTEPHKDAIVRPTVAREQLFQPEFANTGSKADNLQTAYKRSMAKNLY